MRSPAPHDRVPGLARATEATISLDLGAVHLVNHLGIERNRALIRQVGPDLRLANDEAAASPARMGESPLDAAARGQALGSQCVGLLGGQPPPVGSDCVPYVRLVTPSKPVARTRSARMSMAISLTQRVQARQNRTEGCADRLRSRAGTTSLLSTLPIKWR